MPCYAIDYQSTPCCACIKIIRQRRLCCCDSPRGRADRPSCAIIALPWNKIPSFPHAFISFSNRSRNIFSWSSSPPPPPPPLPSSPPPPIFSRVKGQFFFLSEEKVPRVFASFVEIVVKSLVYTRDSLLTELLPEWCEQCGKNKIISKVVSIFDTLKHCNGMTLWIVCGLWITRGLRSI